MIRLLLVAITVCTALPDIAPNPVPRAGESLSPRKTPAVEMSAETVRITLLEDSARIEASFTLANTSTEKEELEVGFPRAVQPAESRWHPKEGLKVGRWGPASLREFSAKVDGVEVKAEPKPGLGKQEYNGWLCWPMTFEANQKRHVEVRYVADTRDDNYSEPSALQNRQVTYILKTGAGWKGNIGEAVIILNMEGKSPDHILRVAPEVAEKDKSCWTWRMKDFEPNADILIQYRVYSGAKEAIEKLSAKLKANGSDIEALLDYADNLAATEQPLQAAEAYVRLHELEVQTGNPVHRSRTEYQPPAYRAAKCFIDAGKTDQARDWAKKARARLEEVAKGHPIMIQKGLRTSKEALAKRVEECKAWAGE
jgi:Domain of unknown function (DUF4424)